MNPDTILLTKNQNNQKSHQIDTCEKLILKLNDLEEELNIIENYYLKKHKKTINNNILFFNQNKYNNALAKIDINLIKVEYLQNEAKTQLIKDIEFYIDKLEHSLNFEKEILTMEEF